MYDKYSMKAEEFIDHQQILDTLAFADEHKRDAALIDQIIEKARQRKGLDHREASVLLACELEDRNEQIFALAEQIKKDFYGNRIVMFAPRLSSGRLWPGLRKMPRSASIRTPRICSVTQPGRKRIWNSWSR